MNRLNLDAAKVAAHRATCQQSYPSNADPCPGTRLVVDDDVEWLGFIQGRVLWGHSDAAQFHIYSPDVFGEYAIPLDVGNVNGRAPVNASEDPLPIFDPAPQQQLAQQPDAKSAVKPKAKPAPDAAEVKRVLQALHARLPQEAKKTFRAYVKKHRPEVDLSAELP